MARGPRQQWTCPVCGLRYGDFRAPGPRFSEALSMAIQRSEAAQAQGDYRIQGRRGLVLMVMMEAKTLAWDQHLADCEAWRAESRDEVVDPFAGTAFEAVPF